MTLECLALWPWLDLALVAVVVVSIVLIITEQRRASAMHRWGPTKRGINVYEFEWTHRQAKLIKANSRFIPTYTLKWTSRDTERSSSQAKGSVWLAPCGVLGPASLSFQSRLSSEAGKGTPDQTRPDWTRPGQPRPDHSQAGCVFSH